MKKAGKLAIIILSLVVVLILSGCTSNEPTITTKANQQKETPISWSPDRNHIVVIPREYFVQYKDGYLVDVPPASYLIIPVSVGDYEHLAGWGWNAEGTEEDYLDSWLVNSNGDKISESGRSFNYGVAYAFDENPGLGPGTYYIYLSNEFTSASAKKVSLRVSWRP